MIPHFDTFGHRWLPSARPLIDDAAGSGPWALLGIDEKTAAIWRDGTWLAEGAGSVTVITPGHEDRFATGASIDGLPDPIVA